MHRHGERRLHHVRRATTTGCCPAQWARSCLHSTLAPASDQVLLFGVDAVDGAGRIRRTQRFRTDTRLLPGEALQRLLAGGFAWFPGVVISREAVIEAGMFDERFGNMIDLELWVRLFARHGVRCLPAVVTAYSVHRESATQTMPYDAGAIATVVEIFDRARATGVLPDREIDRCQLAFLDRLILGGAYLRLQAGDARGARSVLALYDVPEVRALGSSTSLAPRPHGVPGPRLVSSARSCGR